MLGALIHAYAGRHTIPEIKNHIERHFGNQTGQFKINVLKRFIKYKAENDKWFDCFQSVNMESKYYDDKSWGERDNELTAMWQLAQMFISAMWEDESVITERFNDMIEYWETKHEKGEINEGEYMKRLNNIKNGREMEERIKDVCICRVIGSVAIGETDDFEPTELFRVIPLPCGWGKHSRPL